MPFDSLGNFTRVHNWEDDRQNDIDIVSDRHDEEDDNFADGLNDCMLRDGRSAMTGDLKMNNFQIKNVANGTNPGDAVNKSQFDTALHKTGDETSTGIKQFDGGIVANNNGITMQTTSVYSDADTTVPSIDFKTSSGTFPIFSITATQTGVNASKASAVVYDPGEKEKQGEAITVGYSQETGIYSQAVKPAITSNSNDIATTSWVNDFVKQKGYPNYGAGISFGTGYTAPSNGVIVITISGNYRTAWMNIGSTRVFDSTWQASYGNPDNACYLVAKDSIITLQGISPVFYPIGE